MPVSRAHQHLLVSVKMLVLQRLAADKTACNSLRRPLLPQIFWAISHPVSIEKDHVPAMHPNNARVLRVQCAQHVNGCFGRADDVLRSRPIKFLLVCCEAGRVHDARPVRHLRGVERNMWNPSAGISCTTDCKDDRTATKGAGGTNDTLATS